jgi:small subunit ribosomal protein S18
MARNNQRGTTTRRAPKDLGRRVKKKPCALCRDRTEWVDYKDVPMLRKYMSDRGKIRSRRVTGNCAQHQRALAQAIKTARELILLPYTQRTVTERPGGRGGGRDRGERGERGERAERTLSDTIGADAPRDRDASLEILSDVEAFDRGAAGGSANGSGDTDGSFDSSDAVDADGAFDPGADDADDPGIGAAGVAAATSGARDEDGDQ